MTRPMTAPLLRSKQYQNPGAGGRRQSVALHEPLLVSDAWVDETVHEIDDQIDEHDDGSDQQQTALDHGVIAPKTASTIHLPIPGQEKMVSVRWRRQAERRPAGRSR